MGAMHDTPTLPTIDQLREKHGKQPRAFQAAWKTCGLTDYAKDREATPDEIACMQAYYAKTKTLNLAKRERKMPASPAGHVGGLEAMVRPDVVAPRPPAPALVISEFDLINGLDMALIVIGLSRLYEWPGAILAAMCCLFLVKTQRLAKRREIEAANERTIEVVFWMCFASFALHCITFWNALPIAHANSGYDGMLWVHLFAAAAPALFVSYLSYNSVIATRKIATE